jgi:hypothetical protein
MLLLWQTNAYLCAHCVRGNFFVCCPFIRVDIILYIVLSYFNIMKIQLTAMVEILHFASLCEPSVFQRQKLEHCLGFFIEFSIIGSIYGSILIAYTSAVPVEGSALAARLRRKTGGSAKMKIFIYLAKNR